MKHNELLKTVELFIERKPKQKEIAEALDLSISVIGKRAERNSEYNMGEILKVGEYFDIDNETMMTKMVYDFAQKNNLLKQANNIIKFHKKRDNMISEDEFCADYYPEVFGSCGTGTFVPAEFKEVIRIPKSCVNGFSKDKHYSVINAYGDSMKPYIQDRDLLIFEDYNGEQICDNRIYVFRYEDKIFIKRLVLNINQLIIKSDNIEYKPIILDLAQTEIQIIGKFAGLMRKAE